MRARPKKAKRLGPKHIIRRVSSTDVRSLATLHLWAKPQELLSSKPEHPVFEVFWEMARGDCFAPPARTLSLRSSKLQ